MSASTSPDGKDIVSEQTGRLFVPQTPEPFVHDDDGNLTQDGRWLYTWDAENRLVAMETRTDLPAAVPRLRLEFVYDAQSRRVRKTVSAWQTDHWSLTTDHVFLYDGWLLLAELNAADGSAIRTYTWGLDFSGTLQGAGGIGGVLCVNVGGAAPAASLPCYDGNGNVVALADSATGALVAQYEYDPFGNPLRATGPAAAGNPFRFSTKYTDAETGLLYYGYRYLSTETGRWLGRDPLEEAGGEGLYSQCSNDGVNCLDPLGLFGAGRVARMQSMARDGRLQETTTDHFYAGAISEYSRVPYTAAELRAVVATNSPVPLGHSDFYNPYSDFDFNKEDNDWKTSPVPSWGIGLHFMDIAGAQKRVSEATAACEIDRFERAVHCLQDSQSHTNNGYTGHWWGGAPFGAVFLLTSAVYIDVPGAGHPVLPWRNDNPDRDSRVAAAWLFAELDTHRAVDDWYAACTKCNGSWVRKSAASGASAATGVNP